MRKINKGYYTIIKFDSSTLLDEEIKGVVWCVYAFDEDCSIWQTKTLTEAKKHIEHLEHEKAVRNYVDYYSLKSLRISIRLSQRFGDIDNDLHIRKEALKILLEKQKKGLTIPV